MQEEQTTTQEDTMSTRAPTTLQCELIERPAQPVLSIRTRTPVQDLPALVGKVYSTIGQYLGELQQPPSGAPFAAYYNIDMQDLDVELGFPVAGPLPGRGEVMAGEIPAGRYAACLHIGPYDAIGTAYDALQTWLKEHGYAATGVSYEFYLNDPQQVPPQELQTQVLFQVL
jgi:effector-binding domain-containing protein